LFSVPLAGFDRQEKLILMMEFLDYASERDSLVQVFTAARRDVSLHFEWSFFSRWSFWVTDDWPNAIARFIRRCEDYLLNLSLSQIVS
jgi:hypothetical protein